MFRDLFRHSDAITDLKFRENLEAGGNLNVLFYCIGSVGRSEAVKLYHSFVTPSVTDAWWKQNSLGACDDFGQDF